MNFFLPIMIRLSLHLHHLLLLFLLAIIIWWWVFVVGLGNQIQNMWCWIRLLQWFPQAQPMHWKFRSGRRWWIANIRLSWITTIGILFNNFLSRMSSIANGFSETNQMPKDLYFLKHKARLVTNGMRQRDDLDYNQTFTLVIKPTTIRVVLSLAVQYGSFLNQLNISNAFLHGFLEDIYMR